MKPLRLELTGFLSYAEHTVVDFGGLGAGVILGENGAGKTALVEAIGWCLYGRGRGRSPDDFVSAGGTSCAVSFDFTLGRVRYRVDRQRQVGATGRSYLGLFRADEVSFEQWSPVGGDSIVQTQDAIEQLLGMSYDTWLSTSFVGQGTADAFTRLRPAERKALLADVLELARYEALHEAAKARGHELAGEAIAQSLRADGLAAVLEAEEEAREDFQRVRDHRHETEQQVTELERGLGAAVKVLELAREGASGAGGLQHELEELRSRSIEATRRGENEIERIERDRLKAQGEATILRELVARLRSSTELVAVLEADVAAKRAEAEDIDDAAGELLEKARSAKEAALLAEEKARATSEDWRASSERIEVLSRSKDAACYACGQALTDELRDGLIHDLSGLLKRLQRTAAEQERKVRSDREDAASAEQLAEELQDTARTLREKAQEAELAAERAAVDGERLPEEQSHLEALEVRIVDAESERRKAEADLKATRSEFRTDEERLVAEIAELGDVQRLVEEAAHVEAAAQRELTQSRDELTRAAAEFGRVQERMESFAGVGEELEMTRAKVIALEGERELYGILAGAFGRNGIPALVIENAIPEIEAEANHLLARLTDGVFSVRIDSLRAKKTGGLRETLDITVADAAAERPLEELSGGERQCVDLALRIGLSRLLANRAGRRIETLVLDEAFTALDASHRQRALEIIRTLTDEFPTVLLVTHLQELADAFPTRIEVTRNGGSHVEVVAA